MNKRTINYFRGKTIKNYRSYIIILLAFLGCSSGNKCLKYDETMPINECEITRLSIIENYTPLRKNKHVINIDQSSYESYKKIGELEIVNFLDYTDINRGFLNFFADYSPSQVLEINSRLKLSEKQINSKAEKIAIENGIDAIYLVGTKTDPSKSYEKNINLNIGCINYVFYKYDLLIIRSD